jgi:CRISPR-associated protein Csb2
LGIHYLTGYATATDTSSRDRAEWPPHPGRVFMALVAAHYEGKPIFGATAATDWQAERDALEWLEALDAPALKVSDASHRDVVTSYVPVNDKVSIPANRQPRTFPKVHPHEPDVFLVWPEAVPSETHRLALARLCAKAVRIGHSSSLVQMWLVPQKTNVEPNLFPVAQPSQVSAASAKRRPGDTEIHSLRVTTAGCLRYLDQQFNGEEIEAFFALYERIGSTKGAAQKELKAEFEKTFGKKFSNSVQPPVRLFPALSITRVYSRIRETNDANAKPTPSLFDSNLLVLTKQEGPVLGLESTARLTDALRGAILKTCAADDATAPEWLTGHSAAGVAATRPHLALLPLAFVGNEYADGHLLGLAVAIPRAVSARERGRILRPLLYSAGDAAAPAKPATITLTLGNLGTWTLRQEERSEPPSSLRAETWCAPAREWASVTPLVLERHPKAKNEEAWLAEIKKSISDSCERVGLPRPEEIDIDKTSWHVGAPQANPGQSGYPLLPGKPGAPARRQIHVWLRFANPVEGPVLIGAGRYRGYGFFKPCKQR